MSAEHTPALDVLAIAAHRDDVEQTCGGTLLKMARQGARTGILDLTQGELGSRGSAESRSTDAAGAARILQVAWREALDIPDGRVENTYANRIKIARVIREQRPRVVILPYWKGRHPDHYTCATLGYEACFLAGLRRLGHTAATQDVDSFEIHRLRNHEPFRPFKIVYATLYFNLRPTFVVDITAEFEAKLESIYAYKEQFSDQSAGSKDFPAHAEIRERVASMAHFYGMLAGVKYGEPFFQKEVGLVEDLRLVPVQSI
jgi:N-acetylglucosamine malate deacetylase 1